MPSASILIVDDEPDNFDVIEALLGDQDYDFHYVPSGPLALESLSTFSPDLILLDVMMPGMNGLEVCRQIKARPDCQGIPIIIITALNEKSDLAHCLEAGADDFLTKPVNRLELRARTHSMLRIRRQYQQLAVFNAHLEQMVQARTNQLHRMIFEDSLTQLPSRAFLVKALTEALAAGQVDFALVIFDCDQFQLVNGSFGSVIGDQLLKAVAQRLNQHLRPQDILARLGGDEFCFLLHQVAEPAMVESFIQTVIASFERPFLVENCDIFMTVSAGVAWGQNPEQKAEALLQDANSAMYRAKARGKSNVAIFDSAMHQEMLQRLQLENDLQRALKQEEFVVYYQPIMDLQQQTLAGLEALIRWQHPERGMVSPAEFIPCLEATGLIVPVGIWVLRQACWQLQQWHRQSLPDLSVSVNLSVRQFNSPTLLSDIDTVITETGLDPQYLKLEITESAIMDNADDAIAITQALQERQIQLSIDDFGTGYSSLEYLHRLPVDNLKIDRSFVDHIGKNSRNYYVVNTIVTLGHQLGLKIIAEGVETEEQEVWLQNLGCEFGQGYRYARPLPAAEIEARYLHH
ncbi:EAL domain-containing protein [Synechocystis sp. LKSZ1]|uniref:two-component system response regulator n=1 Tax=Synechocystis sp. LKSZ1 TaxID=3144951 RepID=UPI00336BF8F7